MNISKFVEFPQPQWLEQLCYVDSPTHIKAFQALHERLEKQRNVIGGCVDHFFSWWIWNAVSSESVGEILAFLSALRNRFFAFDDWKRGEQYYS